MERRNYKNLTEWSLTVHRNKNRGDQQSRVWQNVVKLYGLACRAVRNGPFKREKMASQAIASVDSIHRNIAEGYCRRSVREYLPFLNFALGSVGESVSVYVTYHATQQLAEDKFEALDAPPFRLENSLMKLVESVEWRRNSSDWSEPFED